MEILKAKEMIIQNMYCVGPFIVAKYVERDPSVTEVQSKQFNTEIQLEYIKAFNQKKILNLSTTDSINIKMLISGYIHQSEIDNDMSIAFDIQMNYRNVFQYTNNQTILYGQW